ARELFEPVRRRADERQLTLLGQNQQQVLISQKDELAVAVTTVLPLALAVLQINAGENAAVEAEGMTVVKDEVVEVRLQPDRPPSLFGDPSAGSARYGKSARADSGAADSGAAADKE